MRIIVFALVVSMFINGCTTGYAKDNHNSYAAFKEYDILYSGSQDGLSKKVNEALKAGWTLVGGLAPDVHYEGYSQAIAR